MKKLMCLLSLVVLVAAVSTASATLYILPVAGEGSDNVAGSHMAAGQTYATWEAAKNTRTEAVANATDAYIDIFIKVDGIDAAPVSWPGGALNLTVVGGTAVDVNPIVNMSDEIAADGMYAAGFYADTDSWLAAEYSLAFGGYPKVIVGAMGGNDITLGGGLTLQTPPYPNNPPLNWVHFGRIGVSGVTPGTLPTVVPGYWDPINGGPGGGVWDHNNAAAGEASPSAIVVIPEPASMLLLLAGVVGLIRRKK